MCVCVYIYIYIYICIYIYIYTHHIYIYIYIHRHRHRERERYVCIYNMREVLFRQNAQAQAARRTKLGQAEAPSDRCGLISDSSMVVVYK